MMTASTEYRTPTRRLSPSEIPRITDDLELAGMDLVIERQLQRFNEKVLNGFIWFGDDRFPVRMVRDSLLAFKALSQKNRACLAAKPISERVGCQTDFERQVKEQFAFYTPDLKETDPRFGEEKPTLFTGYYTPRLEVSMAPTEHFRHPIYLKPRDPWVTQMSRYEIDFRDGLKGRGLELYYAPKLFDLYLMHLEGGGRVVYRDASGKEQSTYLSFAGSNQRKWRFLVELLLAKNWIRNPAVTSQREFIDENPEKEPEIFSYCPSYVYFKTSQRPPEGSDTVPLTDNRSIATDINYYRFKGALAFVRSERPRVLDKGVEMMAFSRFVLDQDTGGAIRGKARVDFYFGEGDYAELAANTLKQRGDLFFLMLKP